MFIVCALVVAALWAVDYWTNHSKIYSGVEVGSIPLGGKTPEEARQIVEERTGALEAINLTGPEEFTVSSDSVGVNFDIRATVDRAYAVGRQGNILERLGERMEVTRGTVDVPLAVDYDRKRLRDGLSGVFAALAVEPVEAEFEVNGSEVSVTRSRTGQKVDEEKLLDDLEAGLSEGEREYEIPVVTDEPELTTAEAEALKPTQLLGKYRTDYTLTSDQSRERIENLEIASEAVNSTFLAPGETFSMNDTVSSLDYNKTKVIINGQEEKADGGGLCQVTSTLYMAANYAGLDVTERHPHATQLPYIRPGLDATIWFGDINGQPLDMKFENTTDGYVLLREYVVDGFVYAEVWGQPTGLTVQMDSRPTKMGEEQSKWTTYQKVTNEDGKVVYDGILHRDVYEPLVDEKGKTIPPPKVHVPPVNQ